MGVEYGERQSRSHACRTLAREGFDLTSSLLFSPPFPSPPVPFPSITLSLPSLTNPLLNLLQIPLGGLWERCPSANAFWCIYGHQHASLDGNIFDSFDSRVTSVLCLRLSRQ